MGALYDVKLTLFPKNSAQLVQAIRNYIRICKTIKRIRFSGFTDKDTDTLEGCLKHFLTDRRFCKESSNVFRSSFRASYEWRNVLHELWDTMVPYLSDGSGFCLASDNDFVTRTVTDKTGIRKSDYVIRNLCKIDEKPVQAVDRQSGLHVAKILKETKPDEKTCSCFGIFYADNLAGYATLRCPDSKERNQINGRIGPDDRILSTLFIRENFRDIALGTAFVGGLTERIRNDHADIYLKPTVKTLDFFRKQGFVRIPGSDFMVYYGNY